MKIAFFGDSLTAGFPGASFFRLIRHRLPDDELINYGKGGDTVLSLFRRIRRLDIDRLDISFLWVGVNDVLAMVSPLYPVIKILRRQMWSIKPETFIRRYEGLLAWMEARSSLTLAVSPLLIGENEDSRWNRRLEKMGRGIERLCCDKESVGYVDLRREFLSELQGKSDSRFSGYRQAPDLHLTVDGVHLNDKGAALAADRFLKEIHSRSLIADEKG